MKIKVLRFWAGCLFNVKVLLCSIRLLLIVVGLFEDQARTFHDHDFEVRGRGFLSILFKIGLSKINIKDPF